MRLRTDFIIVLIYGLIGVCCAIGARYCRRHAPIGAVDSREIDLFLNHSLAQGDLVLVTADAERTRVRVEVCEVEGV